MPLPRLHFGSSAQSISFKQAELFRSEVDGEGEWNPAGGSRSQRVDIELGVQRRRSIDSGWIEPSKTTASQRPIEPIYSDRVR